MSLNESTWIKLYRCEARAAQKGRCAYCMEPIKASQTTADHVRAIRRGGTTQAANIKAACEPCNRTKAAMGEQAFLRLIKNPKPGDSIYVWLAWSRRRVWAKTWRAVEHITRSAA